MDYLIKALVLNEQVRVYVVNSTDVLNEAIKKHDLWPSAASVLGKTMTVGLMMGSMLKGQEALTIKINGNGPIGNVIVDANSLGEVRGYVDYPHVNFLNNDGGFADEYTIGSDGFLDVIKDLKLKDLFTSSIAITGDIAKDFTYYFYESEQTPSAISLGVLMDIDNTAKICGGIIFQLLPHANEEAISILEKIVSNMPSMSTLLQEKTPEEILKLLFDDVIFLDRVDVKFYCPCNKDDFARGLLTLGASELEEILQEDKKIETVCHYCGERYHFDEDELIDLIKESKKR